MRNFSINSFTVIYPSEVVWLKDNNVMQISHTDLNVGAKIIVTNHFGKQKELEYYGYDTTIKFDLSDVLLELYSGDGEYSVYVSLFADGTAGGVYTYTIYVIDGKTFADRSHSQGHTIYVYDSDALASFEVYSPATATLQIGTFTAPLEKGKNTIDISSAVTVYGEYHITISPEEGNPYAAVTYVTPLYEDFTVNLFMNDGIDADLPNPINHTLIFTPKCDDQSFFVVKYRNADGCTRYLGGDIYQEDFSVDYAKYNYLNNDVYRNIPLAFVTSHSKKIRVVYSYIARNAYISDILLSDLVYYLNYDGEWKHCRLASDSFSSNLEETEDFTIDYFISE